MDWYGGSEFPLQDLVLWPVGDADIEDTVVTALEAEPGAIEITFVECRVPVVEDIDMPFIGQLHAGFGDQRRGLVGFRSALHLYATIILVKLLRDAQAQRFLSGLRIEEA